MFWFTIAIIFLGILSCSHNQETPPGLTSNNGNNIVFTGEDREFRFDEQMKVCVNAKGEKGINPGRIDDCGDLTVIPPSVWEALKIEGLTNRSLKGAILQNLSLQNASLQGSDLRNAQLSGANLEDANLWWTRLESLFYDDRTRFPFSNTLLQKLTTHEASFESLPVSAISWSSEENLGEVLSIVRKNCLDGEPVQYYSLMNQWIKKREQLKAGELILILEQSCTPVPIIREGMIKGQKEKIKQIELALTTGFQHNLLFYEGLLKLKKSPTAEERTALLQNMAYTLPGRESEQLKEKIVYFLTDNYLQFPRNSWEETIILLNSHQMIDLASKISFSYWKKFLQKNWEGTLNLIRQQRFEARDLLILMVLDQMDQKIAIEQLASLEQLTFKMHCPILANYLHKIIDLNADNFYLIMEKNCMENRTAVLHEYIKKFNRTIPLGEVLSLASMVPVGSLKFTPFINKVSQWNFNELIQFIPLLSPGDQEKVAFYYVEKVVKEISVDRLIMLSQWCGEKREIFLTSFLNKIDPWSYEGVIQLAQLVEKKGKTKIIQYYIKHINPKLSLDEQKELMR